MRESKFIGLYDKNGKEIHEGHVVKGNATRIVKWETWTDGDDHPACGYKFPYEDFLSPDTLDVEVIGKSSDAEG